MKIQIYQKAGLAKSVKGKVVHLLENGTFTLLVRKEENFVLAMNCDNIWKNTT